MPYEPLHHKYRPQIFQDLVGQETIALTLSNALKQEKITTAYLFTGPRGTGKTSSARILAKSLNCLNSPQPTPEPCGECEACLAIANGSALDVMEIDAASNTGVDNIREIIERSRFAPVQCRYKIYVIDECHMLSTAAFNALLKTLEEPPPKVVFILATTDPQRVLPTIISRCQRFDYRRIPLPEMIGHLKYIAKEEKIAIAGEAVALIAQIANGGLRDAESLLDQLSLMPEEISVAKVWDLVGAVPEQDLLMLLQAINQHDSIEIIQQCRSLLDRGREPMVVLQNLASFYLNLLIAKTAPQNSNMVAVTENCWQQLCAESKAWDTASILHGQQHLKTAETQLKQTTQPRLWLEVTLLGLLPQATVVTQPLTVEPVASKAAIAAATATPAATSKTPTAKESTRPQTDVAPQPTPSSVQLTAKSTNKVPLEHNQAIAAAPIADLPTAVSTPVETTNISPTAPIAGSVSKPASTPTSTPTSPSPSIDEREVWLKVVSCLQPPMTKALLEQHCHLISFDQTSAMVGISSAKLQKLHQGKVANIEAAFAKVCQRKVKVQLEVASKQNSASTNPASTNSTQVKVPPPPEAPPPPSETKFGVNGANPANGLPKAIAPPIASPPPVTEKATRPPAAKTIAANNLEIAKSTERIEPTAMISAKQPLTALSDPPEQELAIANSDLEPNLDSEVGELDELGDPDLKRAINNLTQSFEGELVEMANSDEFASPESISIDSDLSVMSQGDRPSPEDYEDEW